MRAMLNLNDVRCFVHVVDHQGFAPASRALGVPKSTLSKRLAALEAALSARLIQRTSRRFSVTDTGVEFYRHAKAAVVEAEAAEHVVQGRLAEPSGAVRLTASVPTAQYRLAPLLPELARRYPRVRLEIHATDRFVDLVQEGFDIGIRDRFSPPADSELVQRTLATDPVLLVASRRYLRRRGVPRQPADLAKADGLLTSPKSTTWSLTRAGDERASGERVDVQPRPRFVADESVVLLEAARAGLGVACLPRELCDSDLDAGNLVRVLPEWAAGAVTTTLLVPHRRGQLPSVRAVADAIVERFGASERGNTADHSDGS
jgi:DNA-binding transcriptional LysR family regulator